MTSLLGFLLFDSPNSYTRPFNCGKPLFIVDIPCGLGFVTEQEKMLVGTACGRRQYSVEAVADYEKYKRGLISMLDLIKHFNPLVPDFMIESNYRTFSNNIWKGWFGESFISPA